MVGALYGDFWGHLPFVCSLSIAVSVLLVIAVELLSLPGTNNFLDTCSYWDVVHLKHFEAFLADVISQEWNSFDRHK